MFRPRFLPGSQGSGLALLQYDDVECQHGKVSENVSVHAPKSGEAQVRQAPI